MEKLKVGVPEKNCCGWKETCVLPHPPPEPDATQRATQCHSRFQYNQWTSLFIHGILMSICKPTLTCVCVSISKEKTGHHFKSCIVYLKKFSSSREEYKRLNRKKQKQLRAVLLFGHRKQPEFTLQATTCIGTILSVLSIPGWTDQAEWEDWGQTGFP